MFYLSFKFVRKFKFCVSPLVKRYPGLLVSGTCYHLAVAHQATTVDPFKASVTVPLLLSAISN